MEPNISQDLKLELIELLEEKKRRERYNSLFRYYPDTGQLRRELYPKHIDFLSMNCREKICMSGNRTGKTEGLGGFETALHLTGLYPHWWKGRRFKDSVSAWAAGKTNITVRNILQKKLLGPSDRIGTGLIPGDLIVGTPVKKPGVPDAFESVKVKHVSGGLSVLEFKSYESGRGGFEGTEQDLILLDEEPPLDVYSECVLRTMATGFFKGGMVICTFTPMEGMSDTCMHLLENGRVPERNISTETGRYIMMLTWDDAPHLSESEKQSLLATIPAYQRQARTTGVPQLGSGAIYPIDEASIVVDPFPLPPFWPKAYGFDVGWNRSAAVWGAWDREADIVYLYSEHYLGEEKPTVHARAIKSRGEWIPGVIDPAARGRNQVDGRKLFDLYSEKPPIGEGLMIYPADNAVESGIYEVWTRMSTGRLKIFSGLNNCLSEFRMYRRDDKGKVVKHNDHLMDCIRYLIASGLQVAKTDPSGDYDTFFAAYEAAHDGYKRAIDSIMGISGWKDVAGTYH